MGRATSDEGGDIQGSAARPSFENLAAAFAGEAAARLLPASYHGHDDMVAQLLSGGANVHYADAEGQTALHEAAHEVPLPVKHKRQHEHANGWLFSYSDLGHYHWSTSGYQLSVLGCTPPCPDTFSPHYRQVFLSAYSFRAPGNCQGVQALHALQGHSGVVSQLLAAGAAVDQQNVRGRTPLFLASLHGNPQAAKELLAAGASIDCSDTGGMTPLHAAVG